jgi:lysophospholipase L1-like esterase
MTRQGSWFAFVVAAISGFLLFGAPAASAETQLGGVDLNRYCQSRGYDGAVLSGPRFAPNAAYNWHCQKGTTQSGIDVTVACREQYGNPSAVARALDLNDAYSWRCFAPDSSPAERIRITWQTDADIDLHVFDPNGHHAYYANRTAIPGGENSPDIIPESGDFGAHVEYFVDSTSQQPLGFCLYYYRQRTAGSTTINYAIRHPDGTRRAGAVTLPPYGGVWLGASPAGALLRPTDPDCGSGALTYTALGDSYSSGEGNPPFSAGKCHRSASAWPAFVAESTGLVTTNLACTGAKIAALTHSYNGEGPQLDRVSGASDLITLTIGGNDIGFADVLTDCVDPRKNCARDGRLNRARSDIGALIPRLVDLYRYIGARFPLSQVLAVGYPRIFPKGSDVCPWLANNERERLVDLASRLDQAIETAAATAGIRYVSVLNALGGHEMCSGVRNSWVYTIRGPVFLFGPAQGHPKVTGQRAIARIVQAAISEAP